MTPVPLAHSAYGLGDRQSPRHAKNLLGSNAEVAEKGGQTSATVIAADDDGVYIEQATLTDEEPTTETPAITAAPSPSASAETEAKPAAPPAGESGPKQS